MRIHRNLRILPSVERNLGKDAWRCLYSLACKAAECASALIQVHHESEIRGCISRRRRECDQRQICVRINGNRVRKRSWLDLTLQHASEIDIGYRGERAGRVRDGNDGNVLT